MSAAVEELFDGVDDLIRRVADSECAATRKSRARVHAALVAAKNAFAGGANQAVPLSQVADNSGTAGGNLRDYPEQALGVALLVGFGLGLMMPVRP